MAVAAGTGCFLFGKVGDEALSGEQEAGDGCGVLQGCAGDLGRIDNAGDDEVFELVGGDVVAFAAFAVLDFLDNQRAFAACVGDELAERSLDSTGNDACAGEFVTRETKIAEGGLGTDECGATAGNDAFFHRCAGGVKGVLDAHFLLLHLGLGSCTDIDDGDTACELGKTLLELLAVVVAGGFLDLTADLIHAAADGLGSAAAFDDDGGILADGDALGLAEVADFNGLQLDAEVFGDHAATSEDGDVFEHGLAAVAETRCLYGCDV